MFTILTVDNEGMICFCISEFLKERGYRVKAAFSGEEALHMIDQEKPDLVLLDIMMPGIGGEATLREIKVRHRDLPVIMVSVTVDKEYKARLIKEGASDYIPKPIDLRRLEKNVKFWETNKLWERRKNGITTTCP